MHNIDSITPYLLDLGFGIFIVWLILGMMR